ncbi:bifunctional (p)ppGpp synthetase/guanosine-3',5'-bis(diphosphate) 3'-pyrophosphohydrolase [Campylobacter volucris]|uniref:Bifunctional (P)ppGpp synthetase/guanosine-3',5'-bis(Diphosphate) 3'-pyrophosphohydrolase n=1 Tax=Campylobacter volucris TaxID=1031542 RepID=A0AAE5YIS0_9BACT|nr:RelA/SpoT family protein [Campylobacter volucris]AJC93922.1 ppGpp synthetase/guanosine-3',5'-bis(diphosphate) 3' pyrophosphohydrolase [Campylobacter volucris LMG 24379]KAB0580085.1 bifunctional (p)ppGpp synthetase/guanosine-3',5'-bis(diphosphate) 3'-pyrophosphohydrolase [Campylobacter volucris]MBF7047392.1 bifunctional (p)ppGpp synthetase/guanosine-3',5'-bis(diphosphate) 3'-pyrophosphohydrolase [Campylobacter volucris]QBL13700.1 bifunctional (p)ppGpp synthetase/guanosine-3',5'-bis(diphosphat
MKLVNDELLLDKLVEDIKNCKDLQKAKDILFLVFPKTQALKQAVDFCIQKHEGQFRKSGEPYAVHPILVASLVAFLSPVESMIIAALLHDVLEDTKCDENELRSYFGEEVTKLVQGLTKIVSIREDHLIQSGSNEKLAKSALTFRNMLLVGVEDVSVLVIKLCDRLHNMLTLNYLREDKQKRISEETLVVYAPIAHRLGISSIKNLLEDLSFKFLLPEEFAQIDNYINSKDQQIQLGFNEFISKIEMLFLENGFRQGSFIIHKRIKHNYSIYLKMQRKGVGLEEVLDLLGVRILVEKVYDCYLALGILHTHFNPLISRFKDYIALPKQNGYQTLHTTLFDAKNIIEAQIRTFDMHKTAEFGVAAHWKYKEGNIATPNLDWLADISMHGKENEDVQNFDAIELYEYAKDSLYIEDIAVYSPKGEIFTLPRGATALDFAYEVHTKVGLHAKTAFVNRMRVPLLTVLKNGDIVSIETSEEEFYRCSWIDSVKTGKARASIRDFCKQKKKELNHKIAINLLSTVFDEKANVIEEWLQKEKFSKKLRQIALDFNYFKEVIVCLRKYANHNQAYKFEQKEQKFESIVIGSNYKMTTIDFDYCCRPKRGDEIIAFRQANGAIIHHKLCEQAMKMIEENKEMVFAFWSDSSIKSYKIIVSIENKKGSLAEFLTTLAKMQVNLLNINSADSEPVLANYFEIQVEFPSNIDVESVKERLKARYKILDFISLNDAYNNH